MGYASKQILRINEIVLAEGVRQMIMDWPDMHFKKKEILRKFDNQAIKEFYPRFNPHITLAETLNMDVKINLNDLPSLTFCFKEYKKRPRPESNGDAPKGSGLKPDAIPLCDGGLIWCCICNTIIRRDSLS